MLLRSSKWSVSVGTRSLWTMSTVNMILILFVFIKRQNRLDVFAVRKWNLQIKVLKFTKRFHFSIPHHGITNSHPLPQLPWNFPCLKSLEIFRNRRKCWCFLIFIDVNRFKFFPPVFHKCLSNWAYLRCGIKNWCHWDWLICCCKCSHEGIRTNFLLLFIFICVTMQSVFVQGEYAFRCSALFYIIKKS